MLRATDVAEYFIWLACQQNDDELLSNMKLQKLMYYAQGYHLAQHGTPLFGSPIEAWKDGPVVNEVYHHYKGYGASGIPCIHKPALRRLRETELSVMNEVFSEYGQFSASTLRNMTHQEPPYKETKARAVITITAIKDYFLTRVDLRNIIVAADKRSWSEIAHDLLNQRRELWQELAKM